MHLQLRGITAGVAGHLYLLVEDRPIYVGSAAQNDVVVAGKGVTRRHALVVAGLAGYLLCSLTSRGKTHLNGQRVDSAVLGAGDELAIGEHVFKVESAVEAPRLATLPRAVLRITAGERAGQSIQLFADSDASLGRDTASDIAFTSQRISRLHARVVAVADGFLLSDAGSTNGTRVNGRPIDKQLLRFGDEITLGGEQLRFEAPPGEGGGGADTPTPAGDGVLCPGRCGQVYPFGLEHCPLDGALLANGRSVVR
jgi:pSer/pThr/pTyr-binding forkhead associated (FHA) protein